MAAAKAAESVTDSAAAKVGAGVGEAEVSAARAGEEGSRGRLAAAEAAAREGAGAAEGDLEAEGWAGADSATAERAEEGLAEEAEAEARPGLLAAGWAVDSEAEAVAGEAPAAEAEAAGTAADSARGGGGGGGGGSHIGRGRWRRRRPGPPILHSQRHRLASGPDLPNHSVVCQVHGYGHEDCDSQVDVAAVRKPSKSSCLRLVLAWNVHVLPSRLRFSPYSAQARVLACNWKHPRKFSLTSLCQLLLYS